MPHLTLISYGVLHRMGPPDDLDLDLCALSLAEPHRRGKGASSLGTNRDVQASLWMLDERGVVMLYKAVRAFITVNAAPDARPMRIAIHCAAGHQRSPAAVEIIKRMLKRAFPIAHDIVTMHRDLTRPVAKRKLSLDSGRAVVRHSKP